MSSEPVATTGDSSPWQPVWDSEYGAFYWCNTETLESQWEVPDGSEAYAAALYAFGQEERSDAVFPAVEGGREVKRLGLRDAEKKGVEDSVNGGVFEVFKKEMQVDGTRTGKTGCETGAAHCKGHLDDMSPGTMGGGEKPKGRAEIGDGDIRHRNGTGGMGLLREGRSAADGLTGNHALSEGFEKATWEETRPVVQSFELRGRPRPCGTHVRFGDENDASGSGDENGALEYGSGNGALQNGSRNGALEDGSRNGALENGSRGARPVFRSEREEEVLDLMEVDDPMDVDSFGGVEKRGRSWIGQSAIGDAHVRMVGENRKVWVCEKTRVLDSGESSVPLVGRKSDVRELANAAERTPPLDAVADVSAAVRETAAAVRKMGTAVLEGTTGDGRERLTPATPHMAVRKSMSNGRGKAAAKGRTTGALEGGAFDRGETDGAGLDEERAAVLGDSLLEAAKERSHEGSETNAQLLADTSKVYGKHVKTTVGDGVKHGAEATVEVEASAQLDAERSDAPGSRALRNSLSQAAEGGELNRNLTPPLTSHQPSVDANREGPENGLTSAPESAAIADPEGGRAGVQSLTSVPGASDGRDSEAERASAVTSASAPEADAGAGGDAGCAALVASASGREKPADVGQKYWFQRYRLFSKFDQVSGAGFFFVWVCFVHDLLDPVSRKIELVR